MPEVTGNPLVTFPNMHGFEAHEGQNNISLQTTLILIL